MFLMFEFMRRHTVGQNGQNVLIRLKNHFDVFSVIKNHLGHIKELFWFLKWIYSSIRLTWCQGRQKGFGQWYYFFFTGRSHVVRASRSDGSLCTGGFEHSFSNNKFFFSLFLVLFFFLFFLFPLFFFFFFLLSLSVRQPTQPSRAMSKWGPVKIGADCQNGERLTFLVKSWSQKPNELFNGKELSLTVSGSSYTIF